MKSYVAGYDTGVLGSKTVNSGWLVSLGYNATTLYVATYDCDLTGAGAATGFVTSVDGISSRIDPHSSDWNHGRVTITLTDSRIAGTAVDGITNKTLAGLMRQKQFKGRAVSVWRINSAMTTITNHDKEFTGYITDVQQSVDGSTFTFICDSWPEKYRKEIPQTVINETDYPLAPRESFGQRLPIVYGTFENEQDSSTYERDFLINNFHYVPSVCVDASIGKFVFAGHEVNSLNNTDIAFFDSSLQNYLTGIYALVTTTGITRPTVSTTNPAYVLLTSPTGLIYWSADAIYLIPTVKGGKDSDKTATRQYLYNQGLTDGSAVLTSDATNQYLTQRFMSLSGAIEFRKASLAADNKLWVNVPSTTGSPTYRLMIWNETLAAGDEGLSISGTGYQTLNFGNFADRSDTDGTAIATTAQWTIEELSRYEYGIKIETSGDVINVQMLCLEIGKPIMNSANYAARQVVQRPNNPIERDLIPDPTMPWTYDRLGYAPRIPTNLESITNTISRSAVFAEIKGREFGSWIDDAARSNTKNAGDLINESSFQIESILRDELGFGDSDITVADFDDAESGRSNTHFSLNQAADAYRIIRELSQATTSITFPSTSGKWKHYILPQDPVGDASFDMEIDWSDMIPVNFYTTGQDTLCNELLLRYHYDYGKAAFTKEYKISNSTSQGTGATGYNHTYERTISVPFFRFDSSSGATNYAEDFADLYLSHWKDPHAILEFDMINHAKFELEEGDVVKFANFERNIGAIGMGSAGNYWSSMVAPASIYWLIIGRASGLDKISYTAFNLHQLV